MTTTIVRARRHDRYVIVDQRAIEDSRLSWAARGVLGYLLSRPDDWRVLVNDLRKRGDLGRDGIYKVLRELRGAGYVRFERARDAHGRIRGGTYFVHEIPHPPHPELPHPALPDEAPPGPVRPEALPITEVYPVTATTTRPTHTTTTARDRNEAPARAQLRFASWVPDELHAPAAHQVRSLPPAVAQAAIDEWAGSLIAGRIQHSPIGYLHTLVERIHQGDFTLQFAERVMRQRQLERD